MKGSWIAVIGCSMVASAGAQIWNQPRFTEPLIVDLAGDGITLTSPEDGVAVDIDGDGTLDRVGWTRVDTDDAFLCVDYNRNGFIDVPSDLVGGTMGPPNGFAFLSAMDGIASRGRPERIANRRPNSYIDRADAIYADLVLWTDQNQNGRSEEDELEGLEYAKVLRLETAHEDVSTSDPWGNEFRSRGRVRLIGTAGGPGNRDAVTVRLARQP